jgi:hypothetical protein
MELITYDHLGFGTYSVLVVFEAIEASASRTMCPAIRSHNITNHVYQIHYLFNVIDDEIERLHTIFGH